jgi:pimeloyl-ACP methyl ester carboxylesterase
MPYIYEMQPIILLHGALGSKTYMQPLAEALSGHLQVHSFNFSGHGGAPFPPTPFSIPLFSDELRIFIETNGIEGPHIFGYSMGGYAALHLAKQMPSSIGSVITLATKFHWDEATAARELNMLDADTIIAKVPALAALLQERHQPNDWRELLERTKELLTGLGVRNALQLEDYASITNKTLLLLGDRDKMVCLEETAAVYKQLPNAQMAVLPDTQHAFEHVKVELLSRLILEFLQG